MEKKSKKFSNKRQQSKELQKKEGEDFVSRRSFLKRSAYSAPVIVALGQLVKPNSVHADTSVPPPPLW